MRIAILISGRATRYDVCLLPLLIQNNDVNIDVFMSINDENENCDYYNEMKLKLKPWLKSCIIKKYIMPEEIIDLFNPIESISNEIQINLQKINGKYLPHNCLSMYFNDNLSFKNACEYADNNNFEYNYYMKYRSDIINTTIPKIYSEKEDNIHLYSAVPMCNFISKGIFKKPIVCDIIAWGNKKTMSIYCNTYWYVLNKINEYHGKYYVHGESSLTDNIYENNVPISYFNIPYSLDKDRRMFDDVNNDSRQPIQNQEYFMKITDKESINYIKAEKQE